MKSAVAWNVKGIEPEARETAREAARRAGMSLGDWLNSVIIESADDIRHAHAAHRRRRPDPQGFSAIHGHLDTLASRLGDLGGSARASGRSGEDVGANLRSLETWLSGIAQDLARCGEETPQRVAGALDRLNERLDQLIVGGRNAASEFERRVAAVDRALDELDGETQRPGPYHEAADDVDEAVDEIAARQHTLDDNGEDDADRRFGRRAHRAEATARGLGPHSDLDRQLREIASKLDTLRRPCSFEDSVAVLRRDLGNIGDALSKAMPRCALDALESQVHKLTHRVDRDRRHGGDNSALGAIEQRLGTVHDVLATLTPAESVGGIEAAVEALSRKIDTLASSGPDAAGVEHLDRAITELRGITNRVASGDALATLAQEVRLLAEKIDHSARPDSVITSIEQRLEALSAQINAQASEAGQAVPSRLEPLIGALNQQLARIDLGHGDPAALGHIEGEIAKLSEKIAASDARLGNAEMIERGLADLFLQIEEVRANAIEAAEFKRDLADLRLVQSESERRTQQTLDVVHNTIERLVGRLAQIETAKGAEVPAESHTPPPVAPRAPSPPMPAAKVPPPVFTAAPPAAPAPAAPAPAAPPAVHAQARPVPVPPDAQERRPIDPDLPHDYPIEPGAGAPRGRAATPAERIAASEAALGPAKSAAPNPNEKANFIAAARRAAQAAAAEVAHVGGRRSDDKPSVPEPCDAGAKFAKFKRPMFMSVAAALVIVAAAQIAMPLLGPTGSRVELPRPGDIVPPIREAAKAKPAASPPITVADTTTRSAAAPIVPREPAATTNPVSTAQPADARPATTSPWDLAADSVPGSDVTGSLPKPTDATALRAPPSQATPQAPDDNLPTAIGGPELRTAALAGSPAAEYEVAVRYAEGRGVPQNFADAARWFERAANRGLAPAQYRLGSLLEKGQGVKKDAEAARRLYLLAADKGNAKAMHNLAVLYAEGIDGKPDYKAASQWFRKAATRGVADSQYNLGILFARGIGVEQNLAESYKWFALAAHQGDQDAGRKRDDVGKRLDPQSLVAAKLAAQTFTAESQPDEAVNVKAPPGGWDRPASAAAPAPAKHKPTSRRTGSS
jgi:localization factor PodJL